MDVRNSVQTNDAHPRHTHTAQRRKILLLAFACFATSISEFAIVGILDVVADSLGISVSTAGLLITAFALSGGIGVPIVTLLLSHVGRRDVMVISLALVAFGSLLCSVVQGFSLIVLSRVFMAIGSGIFSVTCFAIAPALAEKGHEARALSTVTLGFNAALVLGLPIGRFLTQVLPWTSIFWFVGCASFAMIFVIRAIIPDEKQDKPVSMRTQLRLLRHPHVLFTFGITLLWTTGYATLYSYITPYLQASTTISDALLSTVLLVYGLATLLGNRIGGWAADRFGVRQAILGGIVAQLVMLAVLFIINGPSWLVAISVIIWGICSWIPSPVINLAVIQAAPEASDVMLSLNNSFLQIAYAAGSALGGIEVATGNFQGLIVVAAVAVLLGGISTVFATNKTHNVPTKQITQETA